MKIFNKVEATLDSVNSHIEQVAFGTEAWNQIFMPLTKTKVKEETKHYCVLMFNNTPGLYEVRLEVRAREYEDMEKYFNTLFGIQKTLRNIGNTWKQQMNAAKAVAGVVKAVKDGTLDEAQAEAAVEALDAAQYGDRTEWIAKADAALAKVAK